MTKQPNKKRHAASPVPQAGKPGVSAKVSILIPIVILAGAGVWWLMSGHQESRPLSRSAAEAGAANRPAVESSAASQPAVAAVAQPEFQKLKGRWLRPDGGYVVEVRNIEDSGRMDTAYFNPRSIHVARAEASRDGEAMKVFIELRDANYPGSTYKLAYDSQRDQLWGVYYQAALRQSFEVVFVRMN